MAHGTYPPCLKMHEILSDEINDPEFLGFAIDNLSEMFDFIAHGNLKIRDITGLPDGLFGG